MAPKLNVTIGTAFGGAGIGQEAVLPVLADALRKHSLGRLTVFGQRAAGEMPGMANVTAIEPSMLNVPRMLMALSRSAVFVWPGGEVFGRRGEACVGPPSTWDVLRDAARIGSTMLLGRHVMLYGIEAGAVDAPVGRWITRRCLSHRRLVLTVPDEQSAKALLDCGVPADKVIVSADPAFALAGDPAAARELLSSHGATPGEPHAVMLPQFARAGGFISATLGRVLPWMTFTGRGPAESVARSLAALADHLASAHRLRVLLVCLNSATAQRNLEMCREILSHCSTGKMIVCPHKPQPAGTVKALLQSARMAITMSLGGMLLACGAAVPFIQISDRPVLAKCRHIMEEAGLPAGRQGLPDLCVPASRLAADGADASDMPRPTLTGMIDRVIDQRAELHQKLQAFADRRTRLSEVSNRILGVLLEASGT